MAGNNLTRCDSIGKIRPENKKRTLTYLVAEVIICEIVEASECWEMGLSGSFWRRLWFLIRVF